MESNPEQDAISILSTVPLLQWKRTGDFVYSNAHVDMVSNDHSNLNAPEDHIKIHGLSSALHLQESAWSVDVGGTGVLQPVRVSLDIALDLGESSSADSLANSVDYSHIASLVQSICSDSKRIWSSGVTAYGLANEIVDACFTAAHRDVQCITVELELPKAILLSEKCGVKISRRCNGEKSQDDIFFIHKLPLTAIIGVLPHERKRKQPLVFDLSFKNVDGKKKSPEYSKKFDFGGVEQLVSDVSSLVGGRLYRSYVLSSSSRHRHVIRSRLWPLRSWTNALNFWTIKGGS